MFKISPVQDSGLQRKYAELCGIEYREGSFAYAMTDKDTGALMGMSQFEIGAGVGYIFDLQNAKGHEDYEAMFILGRATMNFIDLCENHICRASKTAGNAQLLHAIGFRDGGEHLECDMTGMFDGHCSGEKEK